jgi:type II secretory pathway pseudopilin PulG
MIQQILKNKKGYTIIETMIAISLFIIIVMAGMGALLNANLLHQKSRDQRSILDNLSFIMEDISRNVRTGYNYRCYFNLTGTMDPSAISTPRSCATGGWGIAFESADGNPAVNGDQWAYSIGSLNGETGIFKTVDGAVSFIQLTPNEIDIDTAKSYFIVTGAEHVSAGDRKQPFVVIKLVGTITSKNITTPFTLQTSMSQRLIDVGN